MTADLKRKIATISFILLVLAGTAAYFAPRFLLYADKPVRADAIIVFEGSDISARKQEAYQLRDEGYAEILLVPASQALLKSEAPARIHDAAGASSHIYPSCYENTHVEILRAKKMMDAMGLKTAIMVSSPYHLQRIRMIARKVFGQQAGLIAYVPTRYVGTRSGLTDMRHDDWLFVGQEYAKICWFAVYSALI